MTYRPNVWRSRRYAGVRVGFVSHFGAVAAGAWISARGGAGPSDEPSDGDAAPALGSSRAGGFVSKSFSGCRAGFCSVRISDGPGRTRSARFPVALEAGDEPHSLAEGHRLLFECGDLARSSTGQTSPAQLKVRSSPLRPTTETPVLERKENGNVRHPLGRIPRQRLPARYPETAPRPARAPERRNGLDHGVPRQPDRRSLRPPHEHDLGRQQQLHRLRQPARFAGPAAVGARCRSISLSLLSEICRHGIDGFASRKSVESLFEASPMTRSSWSTALVVFSSSTKRSCVRPATKRSSRAAAARMSSNVAASRDIDWPR